jgi:hypothetical protein
MSIAVKRNTFTNPDNGKREFRYTFEENEDAPCDKWHFYKYVAFHQLYSTKVQVPGSLGKEAVYFEAKSDDIAAQPDKKKTPRVKGEYQKFIHQCKKSGD